MAIDYENKNKILLIDIACPSKNQCGCEACRDATKKPTTHIRDQREREREREREMTRLQCNDNTDCYWLLRWKQSHVTNQIGRLISDEKKTSAISNKMVKTILFESKSITRKLLSELV